jgi:hypothetical protein
VPVFVEQARRPTTGCPSRICRIHRCGAGNRQSVTPLDETVRVSRNDDDRVPSELVLDLDEAFRVLEALEDALSALEAAGAVPGLQDELATVIRLIHGRLGLDEGGVG